MIFGNIFWFQSLQCEGLWLQYTCIWLIGCSFFLDADLPTTETLPKELHPVFFLFVAAPSVASMAWAKIQGSFDHGYHG